MNGSVSITQRLEPLRGEWRRWSSVRPDRCVDYRTLPLTTDELAAADGCPIVAAHTVKDTRLADIEAEAAAIKDTV